MLTFCGLLTAWFLFKATSCAKASPSGAGREIWATLAETILRWKAFTEPTEIDDDLRQADRRLEDRGEALICIILNKRWAIKIGD